MLKGKRKQAEVTGKPELVSQVAHVTGLSFKKTEEVINALEEAVRDELAKGNRVRLMGFGTWEVREVEGRTIKDIRSGQPINVGASRHVGFKTGAVLNRAAAHKRTW